MLCWASCTPSAWTSTPRMWRRCCRCRPAIQRRLAKLPTFALLLIGHCFGMPYCLVVHLGCCASNWVSCSSPCTGCGVVVEFAEQVSADSRVHCRVLLQLPWCSQQNFLCCEWVWDCRGDCASDPDRSGVCCRLVLLHGSVRWDPVLCKVCLLLIWRLSAERWTGGACVRHGGPGAGCAG